MLDGMTPEQLIEWRAYLEDSGTPDWEQAAMITAAVANGFGMVAQMFGAKVEPVDESDLMPRLRRAGHVKLSSKVLSNVMDPEQIAATIAGMFGGPPRG